MKTISLEITSYRGISFGATHYYGKLDCFHHDERGLERIELNRVLTHDEAEKMNEYDKYRSYKEGDTTERFDTRQQLRDFALSVWKEYFPDGEILVENKGCSPDPCKILYAEDRIMTEGNKIWQETVAIDGWKYKSNDYLMSNICKKWDKLMSNK